jgi:hypothetical protein
VSDNRRKWYRIINYKGWLIIALTIIGLYFTNLKDSIIQAQDDIAKVKSDSINKSFIINQNIKSLHFIDSTNKDLNLALAKMGLVYEKDKKTIKSSYDSSQAVIQRYVRDSARRDSRFYSLTRPGLDFNRVLITKNNKDSLTIQLKLQCSNSIAYNIHFRTDIIYITANNFTVKAKLEEDDEFYSNETLESEKFRTAEISLPNIDKVKLIFIWMKGTYTDVPALKMEYPFDKLRVFAVETKQLTPIKKINLDAIRSLFATYK